ncbi:MULTISPECIES: LLM class flavin-dependent oxidoreductase [unclassified Nodularia (in: cyanobacteria)]|uniref:LLM class flavin-dependent oxidoreductase n=1 Tax=unclassified Nodularia (in: cyanobacteria) TaxID=2656917 RepID=UPI00187ED4EF|nr:MULTISPECIES: LLM class flavin-dependent oxidoreductase [unclassified Nodularia (in: cyanobacteria)]MBE9201695.1 LLM class flavin-dependent oxidoreductase [Nodularia sp. LEGE 06071]MCC2691277.1 LLM class flavin-dependent oxidoreductase [Nodularia sp. LEGE 04288]
MKFSLFYFSGDGSTSQNDKYRLFIEGSKFADQQGFSAVWIPERHFDAFGGLYPNPSVLGAAIAMVTEQIQIRSGSVVMPLQHPLRVAEEWAVVDNLSQGRVSLSFAPGWQPNDFVLYPEKYADKKEIMWRDIQTVQKLWQGEAIALEGGKGKSIPTQTFPRPLQPQLSIWITSLSDETFIEAGRIGANILTSSLYQSLEDIYRKISLYRQSLAQHGHDPQQGKVALMIHTFLGKNIDEVKQRVKEPFTNYLKTHLDLMAKTVGQSRFSIDPKTMSAQDLEDLLAYSFESYFNTKVLMGTPESCRKMIDDFQKAGIDEVAALIDFGVDFDGVMESLNYLQELKSHYEIVPVEQVLIN